VALVTGGSRGIGRAIAVGLAAAGHDVAVGGRDAEALAVTCEAVSAHGVRALAVVLDVTESASVQAGVERVVAELGAPAVLVNNAGVASAAPFLALDEELWNRTFAVNVSGAFLVTRAVLPGMLAAGHGRIVNIGSTAALEGFPYTVHYTASKHALLGMTRALALEVARKGVTVNCVCPGFVDTEMTARSIRKIVETTGRTEEEALKSLESGSPQRRLIQPEEVADAVVYLAGDEARGVNGQALVVNG